MRLVARKRVDILTVVEVPGQDGVLGFVANFIIDGIFITGEVLKGERHCGGGHWHSSLQSKLSEDHEALRRLLDVSLKALGAASVLYEQTFPEFPGGSYTNLLTVSFFFGRNRWEEEVRACENQELPEDAILRRFQQILDSS